MRGEETTKPVTPHDAYTLAFRLIAGLRPVPRRDAEAGDARTAAPHHHDEVSVRRGSCADYRRQFPEVEG
jgi:hypothetical protein